MWAVVITQLSGSGPVSTSLSAGNTTGSEPSTSYAQWGHSLCELICVSVLLFRRPCILSALHSTWLLHAFCLLFHGIPEPWGKGFDSDSSSNTECSKVSYSLLAAQLRIPAFVWSLSLFLCGIMLFLLLLLTSFEIRDGDTSSSSFILLKIVSLFISIPSLLLFPATNCLFLKFFYFCSSGNYTCHTSTGP